MLATDSFSRECPKGLMVISLDDNVVGIPGCKARMVTQRPSNTDKVTNKDKRRRIHTIGCMVSVACVPDTIRCPDSRTTEQLQLKTLSHCIMIDLMLNSDDALGTKGGEGGTSESPGNMGDR